MMDSAPVINESQESTRLTEPLRTWAGCHTEYPRHKTIVQHFEDVVAKFPQKVAVICGERELTYSELNRSANRVAHRLTQIGVGPETLVGLCVERSIELISAILGILKAGGAYVPFDPAYPRERLDFMLEDTRVPAFVIQRDVVNSAVGNQNVATVLVEEAVAAGDEQWDSNPPAVVAPNSLAYVMYTSGSTGRPKGVLVENQSILRLVFNTNYCRFGPDEVFLHLAPISFDASTLEIWGALLHGATLAVMPPQTPSLQDIAATLHRYNVTTLWLTAGLFHLFVDEHLEGLAPLKQLLAGGDVLSASHVRRVLDKFPEITVINGYGPTEGTTFTCCHPMRKGDIVPDNVPIGRPISNSFVYILDENLDPAEPGSIGELCAGGDGIARGYLNEDVTNGRFLPDRFADRPGARMYRTGDLARWNEHGVVEFLGRFDEQIKILGHRVEPGEIEAVLLQHPEIKRACVVAKGDKAGQKRLTAYYVPTAEAKLPAQEVKEFLARKLPAYLLPTSFVELSALPLDPNGKVDRSALPSPAVGTGQPSDENMDSQLEHTLVAIWKRVLQLEHVGLDDNFFDLGGDSLLIVAVHAQLRKALERDIELTDLFDCTTIRTLAKHLSSAAPEKPSFTAVQTLAQKQREAFAKQRTSKGGPA
jgi:amino acid adenylation domain-containing protein